MHQPLLKKCFISDITIIQKHSVIWTLIGVWLDLCDTKKVNSNYRFLENKIILTAYIETKTMFQQKL